MARIGAKTRSILRVVLVVLVLVVGVLAYIYYLISQPPAEVVQAKGFTHLLSIYGYGSRADEQLKQPHDVAFDRRGNIYITDTGHRRVLVFSPAGRFIRQIGKAGAGRGRFMTPLGIAIDGDGRVYVADETAGKVVVFDPDGRVIREIRVMMPLKPVVFDGRLYLANYAFVNIYELNGGRLINRLGGKGQGRGEFDLPTGLAVTGKDKIFVADLNNVRIQALGRNGKVKWVVGGVSAAPDSQHFGLPAAIAADENGRLYVVDAFAHQIEVLTARGVGLTQLGQEGQREGEFYYPAGIAYGGQGLLAVADKFNNRVQLFKVDIR